MKRAPLKIFFLFLFIATISAEDRDFTNDKRFVKLVRDYNIQSIKYVDDVGKIVFDPIVEITMKDGRHFSIKHAFSKRPNKLMLFMLDDYKLYCGIDVNGKNIKYEANHFNNKCGNYSANLLQRSKTCWLNRAHRNQTNFIDFLEKGG